MGAMGSRHTVVWRCTSALLTSTALAAAGSMVTPAHAQSTWTGGTDYNTNANWNNNTAPAAAGQSAVFANTGTSR